MTTKVQLQRGGTGVGSATELTELLTVFTGDTGSGGVKGLVPAPAPGDAALDKYLNADGTWSSPSAGRSGSVVWGDITGNISEQTDLQSALDAKQDLISLGTGVETALGVNIETSGSFVVYNGDLGTPLSGVATNLTGTASGLTAGNVVTNADLTGEVTSSGNTTTLTNAAVISKILTSYSKGSGTVVDTDSILQGIQKLDGNIDNKQDNLTATNFGSFSTSLTAKTTPVDTDEVNFVDSAASNVMKKVTLANIKATLKNYFDSFYLSSSDNTITESTTARTLALTDAFKYIRCTNASATTITVPDNATVTFSIGTQIDVFQMGAGQVSFVAAGGVTINKAEGLKIAAQYKAATLKKVGTNEWDLLGAIAA